MKDRKSVSNMNIAENNEGVTLVEIIISLLILAMIFTPMANAFITANKANVKNADMNYATTLAENVMEAVKVLGNEQTAKQCVDLKNNVEGAVFTIAGGDAVSSDAAEASFFEATGELKELRNYVYNITDAEEGTGKYDVRVTFTVEPYSADPADPDAVPATGMAILPNDYQFADLSAFNSTSTVVINPSSVGSSSEDYFNARVAMDLYDLHREWVNEYNDLARDAAVAEYEEKVREKELDPSKPDPVYTEPARVSSLSFADFMAKMDIEKTFYLDMVEYDDYTRAEQGVEIGARIVYDCTVTDSTSVVLKESTKQMVYQSFIDAARYPYTGVGVDKKIAVDAIYLIYSPYNKDTSGTTVSFDNNKVVLMDKAASTCHMNVYLAVQKRSDQIFDTNALPVEVTADSTSGSMSIFSNAAISLTGPTMATSTDMVKNADAQVRIYGIKVEVFEPGGTFTNKVTEVQSSIVEY